MKSYSKSKSKLQSRSKDIEQGYVPSINPREWVLPHYTEFPKWVSNTFRKENNNKREGKPSPCNLMTHQEFVKNFIGSSASPYRGLLLYHGLGTGKTITSISVAESLSDEREIIIMLPASLVSNYIKEITSCGNGAFQYKTKHWYFVPKDAEIFENEKRKIQGLGVDTAYIRKLQGVWSFNTGNASNYEKLDKDDQMDVKLQIEKMIKSRYTFIHYNGISLEKIKEMGRNIFDNKVVIIDEIHNFISAVKNESRIRVILFQMLMEAKNVKIVGLSGTPMINEPREIAYMANLLHGYITKSSLFFTSNRHFNQNMDKIKLFLDEHRYIDQYEIQQTNGSIHLRTVPIGFERVSGKSYNVRRTSFEEFDQNQTIKTLLQEIVEDLVKTFQLDYRSQSVSQLRLLPEDAFEFNEFFKIPTDIELVENLGKKDHQVLNQKVLMRRLQSIVSYFESFDENKFPTVSEMQVVRPKMTDTVFEKYEVVRDKERQQERKSRQKSNDNKDVTKSLNIYKAFSRALCLYCFPDDIPREYPSDLRKAALKEMDVKYTENILDDKEDKSKEKEKEKEKGSLYDQKKIEMMYKLRKNADKYLMGQGLSTYGAKYFEVLKRLNMTKGTSLIYSHFREIEGIGIMEEVLRANGYNKLDVTFKRALNNWSLDLPEDKKEWVKPFYIVFTQDKSKNKILMDVFNSDFTDLPPIVKDQVASVIAHKEKASGKKINNNLKGEFVQTMMITQSGSEGISLKNVRQVHILEPYWNPVRIKQVIGRAARVDSHSQLDKKDRTVDVFMYVMSLGNHKLEEDDNMTSDETIEKIAKRKGAQIDTIQNLMQRAAVDCTLNKKVHVHIDKCFTIPQNYGRFAYTLDNVMTNASDDVLDKKIIKNQSVKTVKTIKNKKTGKVVYFIDETGEIINGEEFEESKELRVIGRMIKTNDGKMKPRFFDKSN